MPVRVLCAAALVLLVTPLLSAPVWAIDPGEDPETPSLPEAGLEVAQSLEAQLDYSEGQTQVLEEMETLSDPLGKEAMSTFEACEVNPCPPGYVCAMICGTPQCFKFL